MTTLEFTFYYLFLTKVTILYDTSYLDKEKTLYLYMKKIYYTYNFLFHINGIKLVKYLWH